ncbi:MAG: hypothetical protein KDJ65_14320 [Anaerolineae bacterium]|nr:hypothetical protein [Anaerolineae bacterium]
MTKLTEKKSLLLRIFIIMLVVMSFGIVSTSAKSSTNGVNYSSLENNASSPTFIDSQAVQTSRLTPSGSRAAQIAQSNQYLAIVYQQGSRIRLRSTKKEGDGAWIPLQPNLGSGAAPSLVFSNNTTVHAVWVTTNQRQIMHVSCTLSFGLANCGTASAINSNNGQTVEAPTITFLAGTLYVAWINSSANRVIATRSSNNGSSWQFNSTVLNASNSSGGTVALAASSGIIHLAYSYNNSNNIKYYRSTDGNNWSNARDFGPDSGYVGVSNPSIEANGSNVYLAWDSLHNATAVDDGFQKYALIGALSINGGVSWVDASGNSSNTPVPRYITSKNAFGSGQTSDRKRTRNVSGATPSEEAGLRPSVALNELDRFAIVWQERPDASCVQNENGSIVSNGTSEIYYAYAANPNSPNSSGWWGTENTIETPKINFYSIDPDLVIDSSGNEHFVFMKSSASTDETQCRAGGGATEYAIYYRGPYYVTIDPAQAILPIITK